MGYSSTQKTWVTVSWKKIFFKLYYNKQSGIYSEYWSSGCDFIDWGALIHVGAATDNWKTSSLLTRSTELDILAMCVVAAFLNNFVIMWHLTWCHV